MAAKASVSQLVVIGASAGGISALSTLVGTLPSQFPAPVVIAQHLEPARQSYLADILSRRSTLPVRLVRDHEPLEPGVVYVVPANHDVEITDHMITLRDDAEGGSKPSVDLLLSSAATVFGENLIAVILTGTGTDGAIGARAVKEQGGMVVIQNPESAKFAGMPSSVAPTLVDVVSDLETIGSLLYDLLTGVYLPQQPAEHRTLRTLLSLLHDASGIDFTRYKTATVRRRLQRRMAATGMTSLSDYMNYVQDHPDEFDRLVSAFLIKVTEFFRDPELFNYLRDEVLPEIVSSARARSNEIRLWSAGCATGEEAYSLAILLAEVMGDELESFTVRIFATDLDTNAIAYARRGIYPATALSSMPPEMTGRYFVPRAGGFEVNKRLRSLVVFGQHDLGQRPPFPNIDLCLCRNVLIYFTSELQHRALQLFAFALRNNGYLVLGNAESPGPMPEYFSAVHPHLRIYRRVGERLQLPDPRLRDTTSFRLSHVMANQRRMSHVPQPVSSHPAARPITGLEQDAALLRGLPIGVISIARRYDIQTINPAARRLLRIHGTAVGEDVVHLTDQLPAPGLRAAIDAARGGEAGTFILELETIEGERQFLQLSCTPLPTDADERPERLVQAVGVQITILDITATEVARHGLEDASAQALAAARAEQSQIETQFTQLQSQIQRVMSTNRELETANNRLSNENAVLRITNDEFLLGNEELQAAMEEVETLNEELQASNEELETLNEELQATIEELNTTNDDLEARRVETQLLASEREEQRRLSEEERGRLSAILLSMTDAVLVVDRKGGIVVANAAAERLFGTLEANPPLDDEQAQPLPLEQTPRARASRGEAFTMTFTMADPEGGRRWFEATGNPIDGAVTEQGGVVVIRDITDRSLRRMQEEFIVLASHELRSPLTPLRGHLQLLAKRLGQHDNDEVVARHLAAMHEQVDRLQRLQDDLLDIARLQGGRMPLRREPVDLVDLLSKLVEAMRTTIEGLSIDLQIEATTLVVSGDATRLGQVVVNLLNNAERHASDGGRVDLRLRREGGDAVLEVLDFGPGIPAESLPHIFERFFQVDTHGAQAGLGVGLFITREIVQAHGGTITAASEEGHGTTFTVRLPLLDATESEEP